MRIFAVSDLHLSFSNPKPMDIFGKKWTGYEERLRKNWIRSVRDDDLILIAGDISWAMRFDDALTDLNWLAALPGKKVMVRGNHDYWWTSITRMREAFPDTIYAVQNDCLRFGKALVCGTRGWAVPDGEDAEQNEKIFSRELARLRLSLDAAARMREEGDRLFVMTHYPPYDFPGKPSAFTEAIAAAKPETVVYGHLHGAVCDRVRFSGWEGIPFLLTSLDAVDADPILIATENPSE